MGAVTMATAALGGLTSLAGNRQSTRAAVASAKYNAGEADRQAGIYDRQAGQAVERGEAERLAFMRNFQQEQGMRAARMGASGIDVNSGSNLDVLADSASSAALDASTIRSNAADEAWDYRERARGARQEASLQRAQAKNAKRAGRIGAVGSLLGTAGSLASAVGNLDFSDLGFGSSEGGTPYQLSRSQLLPKEKAATGSR